MNKLFLLPIIFLFSGNVYSAYIEGIDIQRVHTKNNGFTYLKIANPPEDTCDWYAEDFRFKSDTEAGKAMLSNILSAHAQSKPVTLWYTPSTGSGTVNETCTEEKLAEITGVGQ
ncbi:hypothetical protein ACJJIG_03890 [Microbulbifer sp. SSSA007]|uniref:hypothetical protein n=1 Tax=Microbulbifer sp. SSSA007 TaxID=3243379 RepID=UPI0040390705